MPKTIIVHNPAWLNARYELGFIGGNKRIQLDPYPLRFSEPPDMEKNLLEQSIPEFIKTTIEE